MYVCTKKNWKKQRGYFTFEADHIGMLQRAHHDHFGSEFFEGFRTAFFLEFQSACKSNLEC